MHDATFPSPWPNSRQGLRDVVSDRQPQSTRHFQRGEKKINIYTKQYDAHK